MSTYRRRDWGVELLEWTWIRGLSRAGKRVGGSVGSRGGMILGREMILKDPERKSTRTMRTQVEGNTTGIGAISITEASEDKGTEIEGTEERVREREVTVGTRGIGESEVGKGEGITEEVEITVVDMIDKTGVREGTIEVTGSRGRTVSRERSQSQWLSSRWKRTIDYFND